MEMHKVFIVLFVIAQQYSNQSRVGADGKISAF